MENAEVAIPPSSLSNRKLVLAGQIAFFPTGILTTLLGPMLPILIVRWALNDTQAGRLFLAQFLAQLLGVLFSGVLVSRWGFRPAFLISLLLMAIGVSFIYAPSPWIGLAAVATYGLGLGLIIPADNLLIAEVASDSANTSRSGAVSLLNFFWGVGAVSGSLLVAWTSAHHRLPWFLGATAVFLVLLAFAMRNLEFPAAEVSPHAEVSWRKLLTTPAIWLFAIVFFFYPGAETAVGNWIGSYVARMGTGGAEMASMMPAFFWVALSIGRALGPLFLPRVSERRVLQVGYTTASTGIIVILFSSTLMGVILGASITGLSFATLYPVTVARLSHRFGVAARSIGSFLFSLAALGPAILAWLVGVISSATASLRAGLVLPLAATVILLFIHLFNW